MLPAADPDAPLDPTFTLTVPSGADYLQVTYEAVYTGAWNAVLFVYDPAGNEVTSSLDYCGLGINPGANMAYSCVMDIYQNPLPTGDWTTQLAWQLGEGVEEYTIVMEAFGYS